MKITEELKKKIDAAETLEEKKSILSETGVELTDDELEGVAGGFNSLEYEYDDEEYDIEPPAPEEPLTSGGFQPFFIY